MKLFLIVALLCHLACSPLLAQDTTYQHNKPLLFRPVQLVVPAALIGSGLLARPRLNEEIALRRDDQIPGFYTDADDFLAASPVLAVYMLDLAGLKARNDFLNRSAIVCKGELMMLGTVYLLKHLTDERRPDGSDFHSFPSNHAAQAFLAATFLSQEYRDRLPWIPFVAYSVATSVGVLRIANNKHYVGDVLVGAGLGILTQKLAYWTHQYKWGRRKQVETGKW